jgi:hypothetical protein
MSQSIVCFGRHCISSVKKGSYSRCSINICKMNKQTYNNQTIMAEYFPVGFYKYTLSQFFTLSSITSENILGKLYATKPPK